MPVTDAEGYIEDLLSLIELSGGVLREEPTVIVAPDGLMATLRCEAFWVASKVEAQLERSQEHRLVITLGIDVSGEFGEWRNYRFHFMGSDDRCVFRYDNAPHYPGLPFFPHHKHSGSNEDVTGHPLPKFRDILKEVRDYTERASLQV
jgi:hypothetical protein